MVNFAPDYVNEAIWKWSADRDAEKARIVRLNTGHAQADVDAALDSLAGGASRSRWRPSRRSPTMSIISPRSPATTMSGSAATSTAFHDTPTGLTGVQDYPNLFAELIRRGWSDADLAKLAGGNILRVMRQAEAVSKRSMENPPPPTS